MNDSADLIATCKCCKRQISFAKEREGLTENCPHCGKFVSLRCINTIKPKSGFSNSSRLKLPQARTQSISIAARPFHISQSPKQKPAFGFTGFLACLLLFLGAGNFVQAIVGFNVSALTGQSVVTERGWMRAAIENKPEIEVNDIYANVSASDGERAFCAVFGFVCVTGGIWILTKKYGTT